MNDHYDAISIGSGLGGLTAGALAALDGKKVLVLERHNRFGGAALYPSRLGPWAPGPGNRLPLRDDDGTGRGVRQAQGD